MRDTDARIPDREADIVVTHPDNDKVKTDVRILAQAHGVRAADAAAVTDHSEPDAADPSPAAATQ
jgi:hypothetical protein